MTPTHYQAEAKELIDEYNRACARIIDLAPQGDLGLRTLDDLTIDAIEGLEESKRRCVKQAHALNGERSTMKPRVWLSRRSDADRYRSVQDNIDDALATLSGKKSEIVAALSM